MGKFLGGHILLVNSQPVINMQDSGIWLASHSGFSQISICINNVLYINTHCIILIDDTDVIMFNWSRLVIRDPYS